MWDDGGKENREKEWHSEEKKELWEPRNCVGGDREVGETES